MTLILGIDPGYKITAFVLGECGRGEKIEIIDSMLSKSKPPSKKRMGVYTKDVERSTQLAEDVHNFLDCHSPIDKVFIEALTGTQSAAAARQMSAAFYTITTSLNQYSQLPFETVNPSVCKAFITGKRNATKIEMIQGVLRYPCFQKWPDWPVQKRYKEFSIDSNQVSEEFIKRILLLKEAEHIADAGAVLLYGTEKETTTIRDGSKPISVLSVFPPKKRGQLYKEIMNKKTKLKRKVLKPACPPDSINLKRKRNKTKWIKNLKSKRNKKK